MKIGYSFWGFLGDVKLNSKGEEISTPDGNAFYSWSIIKAFQDIGIKVQQIFPDRDISGFIDRDGHIFDSWGEADRKAAYKTTCSVVYNFLDLKRLDYDSVKFIWNLHKVYECAFILHEWRMEIKGRNSLDSVSSDNWQPDLFLQNCLIKYCNEYSIPMIIFDLDYKLEESEVDKVNSCAIAELGDKWHGKAKRVNIPFGFDIINEFDLKSKFDNDLIYIGNRYERDWCIDKYIDNADCRVKVHGNWNEGGRDSAERWPNINFGHRLQTSEMRDAYSSSATTILLAKDEYCKYHFMTARIIEAIFYGSLPLFIEEYGKDTIKYYAGEYAELLTVHSAAEVASKAKFFSENYKLRNKIIMYLRKYLSFMDGSHFVSDVLQLYFCIIGD